MAEDYSCSTDVSAQHPDKLKELQAAFMAEAIKYNVLPLDDRAQERFNATLAGRPEYMGGRTSLTLYPGMIGMKENAFIDVKNRSSSITAELESGGCGRHRRARWRALRLEPVRQGRAPAFAYNFLGAVTTISSSERLPAGPVTVTYDFAYDGGGNLEPAAPGRSRSTGRRSARADSRARFHSSTASRPPTSAWICTPPSRRPMPRGEPVHRKDQAGDHQCEGRCGEAGRRSDPSHT